MGEALDIQLSTTARKLLAALDAYAVPTVLSSGALLSFDEILQISENLAAQVKQHVLSCVPEVTDHIKITARYIEESRTIQLDVTGLSSFGEAWVQELQDVMSSRPGVKAYRKYTPSALREAAPGNVEVRWPDGSTSVEYLVTRTGAPHIYVPVEVRGVHTHAPIFCSAPEPGQAHVELLVSDVERLLAKAKAERVR